MYIDLVYTRAMIAHAHGYALFKHTHSNTIISNRRLLSTYELLIWLSELIEFDERKSYYHTHKIVHFWMSVVLNLDLYRFVFSMSFLQSGGIHIFYAFI